MKRQKEVKGEVMMLVMMNYYGDDDGGLGEVERRKVQN